MQRRLTPNGAALLPADAATSTSGGTTAAAAAADAFLGRQGAGVDAMRARFAGTIPKSDVVDSTAAYGSGTLGIGASTAADTGGWPPGGDAAGERLHGQRAAPVYQCQGKREC